MPKFRPQFALRTLFVVVTVLAILCAWAASWHRAKIAEKLAVETLEKFGANVDWEEPSADEPIRAWLANRSTLTFLLGDNALGTPWAVSAVNLKRPIAKQEFLQALSMLPRITSVNLSFSEERFDDHDLEYLSSLNQISDLNLSNSKIYGKGLSHLKCVDTLRELDLSGNPVSDEGCKEIARFTHLESLDLAGTLVGDAGIRQFAPLQSLKELRLLDCGRLDDDASTCLCSLKSLQYLSVGASGIGEVETYKSRLRLHDLPLLTELDIRICEEIELARLPLVTKVDIYAKLIRLHDLSKLTELSIDACERFSLSALPELKKVELVGVELDAEDIRQLAKCDKLETLSIRGWGIYRDASAVSEAEDAIKIEASDDGSEPPIYVLRAIGSVKHLKHLAFSTSRISEDGLRELAKCPELEELDLDSSTAPGDAAVLSRIKTLRKVYVDNSEAPQLQAEMSKWRTDVTVVARPSAGPGWLQNKANQGGGTSGAQIPMDGQQ